MLGNASFGLGLALGLLGALAVWAATRLWRRLRDPPDELDAPRPADATFAGRSDPPDAPAPSTLGPGPRARPALPWSALPAASMYGNAAQASFADPVQLSYRVVLHLARLPPVGFDDLPGVGRTQRGMVTELACAQSSLSEVLKRLVASGVVRQERQHVRGFDRRVLTYVLTQRGERLARDLADPVPARPRSVWELRP